MDVRSSQKFNDYQSTLILRPRSKSDSPVKVESEINKNTKNIGEKSLGFLAKTLQAHNNVIKNVLYKFDGRAGIKEIKSEINNFEQNAIKNNPELKKLDTKIKARENAISTNEKALAEIEKTIKEDSNKIGELLREIHELKQDIEIVKQTNSENSPVGKAKQEELAAKEIMVKLYTNENSDLFKTAKDSEIYGEIINKLKSELANLKNEYSQGLEKNLNELKNKWGEIKEIKANNSLQEAVQKRDNKTINKKLERLFQSLGKSSLDAQPKEEIQHNGEVPPQNGSVSQTAPKIGLNNLESSKESTLSSLKEQAQQVGKEVKSLQTHAGAFSDEAKALGKTLMEKLKKGQIDLSPEEMKSFSKDLQEISEQVKSIETKILKHEENIAKSDPKCIASKESQLYDASMAELNQIKKALKSNGEKTKFLITDVPGKPISIEFQSRQGGMGAGSSTSARETFLKILSVVSRNSAFPESKTLGNEILELLSENDWTKNVLEKHNLSDSVETTRDNWLGKTSSSKPSPSIAAAQYPIILKNDLFDQPGNPALQKSFLSTYRGVMKDLVGEESKGNESKQLFTFLTQKFNDPETSLFAKQQILQLANKWVSDPFVNNNEFEQVNDQVKALILLGNSSPTLSPLAKKLETSIDQAKKASTTSTKESEGTESVNHLITKIRGELSKEEYQKAVSDFAQSLTTQSGNLLKKINSAELNNKQFEKNPINVKELAENFNKLSNFVIQSIVNSPTQEEAARVIRFFTRVQNELVSSERPSMDFNSCMAIHAALNGAAVNRLNKTKSLLSDKTQGILASMEKLFDKSKNFKNLQEKMESASQPVVPYFAQYLSQVIFADESPAKTTEGNINTEKTKMLGKIINSLKDMQSNLPGSNTPIYKLSEMPATLDEKASYEASLALEPRTPKQ